jgi:predicted small lipoprotein YifL
MVRKTFSVVPAKAGTQFWIPAFAGMTKVVLLATFVTLTLAACGRKDVPDYPTDAIDRPGALERERNRNPRYY